MSSRPIQFSAKDLILLAGRRVFDRGERYFQEGRLVSLHQSADRFTATVRGNHSYSVSLSPAAGPRGELAFSCDCPMGADDVCCKHVVALGLAALRLKEKGDLPTTFVASTTAALTEHLNSASVEELRSWLKIALEDNETLRNRIAASLLVGDERLAHAKSVCDAAMQVFDYLDWEEVPAVAQRIENGVVLIEDAQAAGDEVSSQFLQGVLDRLEEIEEYFVERTDLLSGLRVRVADLHAQACVRETGDVTPLLGWLVREVRQGSSAVQPVLEKYADALGPAGLAQYCKRIAQARAAERKALAGLEDMLGSSSYRTELTALQYELERCTQWQHPNDISAMVAVMGATGTAFAQQRVFEWLVGLESVEGQERAFAFARELLAEAAPMPEALVARMASLFQRLGRDEDLAALGQRQLDVAPTSSTYFWLQEYMPAGAREKLSRALVAKLKRAAHGAAAGSTESPHAWEALFRIYLAQGKSDEVWAIYRKGLVSKRWGIEVAEVRGQMHPDEAVALCWELLPSVVAQSASPYDEPTRVVALAVKLRRQHGQHAKLASEVAAVRAEYKRRRNFMKRLDELGV